MHTFLEELHNLLRWVVVLGGAYALLVMLRGLITSAKWTSTEATAGKIFTYSLHLQLLVGLVLSAITPLVRSGVMAPIDARMSLIEHVVTMILAVVAAQVGTSTARRASTDRAKFLRSTIGYLGAGLFILWATPWGRNLVPWG